MITSFILGIVYEAVVFLTTTNCVSLAKLPLASVAVQVTVVFPTGNPLAGALLVTNGEGSALSLTIAEPIEVDVSDPVELTMISAGATIVGRVVSTIVTI